MKKLLQAALGVIVLLSASQAHAGRAVLNLVLVLDGMRPDLIDPQETPNLWRLRQEGVNFINGHSVFPTVTRVNSTAIATGMYPEHNGIFGNTIYVRAVDANHAFGNDDYKNLQRLDAATGGHMVLAKSLAELLAERGKTLAVVHSGTTGSALLANPRGPQGVGVLINAWWQPGVRVAFPDPVNDAILRRFMPAPPAGGAKDSFIDRVNWTERVLRDYVLPELKPDVVINWLTEPDHTQHAFGPGSPQARAAIRNDDREIGLLLDRLRELGLADKTNILVVSDHGFSHSDVGVDVTAELIKAGLKAGPDSDDVVVASSGEALLLHVRNHDAARIGTLVSFLQLQPWTGVLFTAKLPSGTVEGRAPATFALDLIHLEQSDRAPDIVMTFPWSSAQGPFGLPGTSYTAANATGPLAGTAGNHGNMSPWTVRNTFFAWGPDFKRGVTLRTPAGNVDIAPTLLTLMGLDKDVDLARFDGRPLREALLDGPDEEQIPVDTHTYTVEILGGSYRAALQFTVLGGHRYVDKSWRIK
jgi:predicted AlkP superfamily pyrophosphatase or phosphodiesterase